MNEKEVILKDIFRDVIKETFIENNEEADGGQGDLGVTPNNSLGVIDGTSKNTLLNISIKDLLKQVASEKSAKKEI